MTFAEWKASILTYLDVDAARRGIEPLRASFTMSALADMKHFVPCFQDNRYSYEDLDNMPFGELAEIAAEAAAMYIKARVIRLTEKDLNLASSFQQDYVTIRRRLARECQTRTQIQPLIVELVPTRGDTFEFEVFLTLDGLPIDPTGHIVRFTVKEDSCDPFETAVLRKSTEPTEDEPLPAIGITDAVGGKVQVALDTEDTALLQPGKVYHFDVEVLMDTGKIYTCLTGTIRGKQDSTTKAPTPP